MRRLTSYFNFVIILFFVGCSDHHMKTADICKGNLHVEFYSTWLDIGKCYLTDSINFRIPVGEFDFQSEYCMYKCDNDTVVIYRMVRGNGPDSLRIKEAWGFSIMKLKKLDNFKSQ